jgi:ArsR family transcriptional regulator
MGVDTLSEASMPVNMSCMERLIAEFETCCQPLMEAPLASGDAEVLAGVMGALADPARLRLLSLLAASPNGECCGCDLTEPLGLSQPTVSHHLKVLYEAGLVDRDKRGTWVWYRVVPGRLASLRTALGAQP